MNIETANRTYKFKEEYTTVEGEVKTAKVFLKIDENSKTFEVTPGDRMAAFSFSGKFSNKDFAKWSAVSKLVYMAIEFAINDLKLKPEEKDIDVAETTTEV